MISVVIPLYNKAHTIERTLGSVLNQTFTDIEVVIVNDGSTDNGVEVIKNFTSDPRIRIINQENQGVSVARNRGVAESKYEYIAFLDGDDEWLPAYLFKMVEAIKMYPDAGMFCCAGYVRNSGGTYERIAKKYAHKICPIDFFENPHVFLHASASVVKKSGFLLTDGFPVGMKRNEDFALFYSLALLVRVIYVGLPLSVYVGDVDGQATKKQDNQSLFDVIRRYNVIHKFYLKNRLKNKLYVVFLKYELRHQFLVLLRRSETESINILLDSLEKSVLNNLSTFELVLFRNKNLYRFGAFFILVTKFRWRLRGFSRVN